MTHKSLYNESVELLRDLIRTPSFSREEAETARIVAAFLCSVGIEDVRMSGNNVWAYNKYSDASKPTMLLCSHHDTVRPNPGYTRDPFDAAIEDGRLYGLGSNDAGASVVSLVAAFRHYYERQDLKYNLCLAIVAEEEISGPGGVRSILPEIGLCNTRQDIGNDSNSSSYTVNKTAAGVPAFAIVGEPTGMQLAIAEKGLMVLDCVAYGKSGHAARDEGENAIYKALPDIEWFRTYGFPRVSDLFGEVKMSVTIISAGTQHNVIPAECRFTVDCRVTEQYTNEEVLETVRQNVSCEVTPRSTHLKPSSISPEHPIVKAGVALGLSTFGSPTTSDQVALNIPSVKVGPGQSARSHNADEYVMLAEIEQGIDIYIELLGKII